MKTILMKLPALQLEIPSQGNSTAQFKVTESYANFVTKNIIKIENRFKVLGYPLEQIRDAYSTLVKDKT